MVGSGASFAAAPRSSRQLASTFLSSTFTIFAIIQNAARDVQEVDLSSYHRRKAGSHGIRSDDNAVTGVSICQLPKLYQRTQASKDDCHAHDLA
jgi:hypothetical protein